MRKLNVLYLAIVSFLLTGLFGCQSNNRQSETTKKDKVKLYWFIPDGVRAEPDLFKIYQWAREGELPNIKRMMDNGTYGYSLPVFPTHTPVNFATLLTGTNPKTHGVADGPMHVEGHPLNTVSIGGFRSTARKIPAAWTLFENEGMDVFSLSMPGSTPPELEKGVVVRGRWGGWGADVHAINFEAKMTGDQRIKQGRGNKLFYFGPELTRYIEGQKANDWNLEVQSYGDPIEIKMSAWGANVFGRIYDSTDDNVVNYDKIIFSSDKDSILADLEESEWSEWHHVQLKVGDLQFASNYRFHVIKLEDDGFFRVRIFYDNINEHNVQPGDVANGMRSHVGPMMDFVDNFPPQLIYYQEDKSSFLDEMHKTFDWHSKAIPYVLNEYHPDVMFHDIYSPNQMLTSRWWLGYVDSSSTRYGDVSPSERQKLWGELKGMYKRLDQMLGEIMDNADENTIIVFSSDHGANVLNKWVRVNNLLAKNGYLKYSINKETGIPLIDWDNSKAVYLKMMGVYIHPDGLGGDWNRADGPDYDKLREEITKLLLELEDENGIKPVTSVIKWENAEEYHELPKERVGDLVISNRAGYGWNEEITGDLKIFDIPLKTGYKQSILVDETNSMWTPFMIMGPGVKKGVKLSEPIRHKDQLPTILSLMGVDAPEIIEGQIIDEAVK